MPLREREVVAAVKLWLESAGFQIAEKRTIRGFDIDASHPSTGERWIIEAKGGAGSGKDPSNTAFQRVATALLSTASWSNDSQYADCNIAMAVPRSKYFDTHVGKIAATLATLGISLFQVTDGRIVQPTMNPRTAP
ncbi:MAG: hypothetical protein ACT6RL_05045 [Neoaquamicrobium sediminum]|uniref:hypothetical protein n=1 Tax=Neoaquamicrobium sediminum TaxID=1849104 RepID=UPI00403696FB